MASDGVDWDAFLALAERHGLRPLAHRALEGAGVAPPHGVARALWIAHAGRAQRNRAAAAELERLVRALDAAGIACIPYKGPTLALAAYGDVGLREFGDLDVLVRPGEIMAAKAVLASLGYEPEFKISAEAEHSLLHAREHYHLVMRGPGGAIVELHWHSDPDFPVERDDDAWWSGRRAFSPDELMLVLLIHGSKHHWMSLHWLADVAALARRERIDWAWVANRARELHCRRRVAVGVALARSLLGAPIPAEPGLAAGPRDEALAATFAREAFGSEAKTPALRLLARNAALYDLPRHRLRHAAEAVFAPTYAEWTRWRLPRALFFLYLPLRLARLTAKHLLPHSRSIATPRTPPPRPNSRG
ncbi:MAG TPA: nucleotidyltransferase family protein [Usitatibacter sp.]|nr:nucleotidyltransferase family protein [Usitatibacter sp.]